jgi:hypothetical protein
MKKIIFLSFLYSLLINVSYGQVKVSKMFGKNDGGSTWGFGGVTYVDFPVEMRCANEAIRIEAMDATYYPQRNTQASVLVGYLTSKVGFKYVFSKDYVGFYIVPAIGYSYISRTDPQNVLGNQDNNAFAWSFETGYAVPVGKRRNTINFGLEYQDDIGDVDHRISSLSLRVSFNFRPWWTWPR